MGTEKATISSADLLKWIGERRDGFLVAGAVLYGLGYLVWSYNAWRNHLGQLPAIEFQYFIAGLVPGAIIATAWVATKFFTLMQDKAFILFTKNPFLRWVSIGVTIVVVYAVIFLTFAIDKKWLNIGWTKNQLIRYTAPLLLINLYFSLLFMFPQSKKPKEPLSWLTEKYLSLNKYLITFMFCFYSLVIFIDLYPSLPQELGGPQPRCAYVDLVRDDLAPPSLSFLASNRSVDNPPALKTKVVRSVKLKVYFSSSDYLLVRTAKDANKYGVENLENSPLYELRKEVIRVVYWCPK